MIEKRLSALSLPTRKITLELKKRIKKDAIFNEYGAGAKETETYRPQDRQDLLYSQRKSKVRKSMHTKRLAVDMVPVLGKGTKIFKYLWNKQVLNQRLAELGVDSGFRSLGITYKWDYYHFEMPQIWQNSGNCYAFSFVNAMQKALPSWRKKTTYECYKIARNIDFKINNDYYVDPMTGGRKKRSKSTKSALYVAIELGYIRGFRSEYPKSNVDWYNLNKEIYLVSQKRKDFNVGTRSERWAIHRQNIKDGKGIYNHVGVGDFHDMYGVTIRNSHEDFPSYTISDLSAIHKVYILDI